MTEQQSGQIITVSIYWLGLLWTTIHEAWKSCRQKKVWVCLFTCVAVRAIHQEIVADLSTEEFLLAMRRFIARRGKPQQIVLDNVPQFKLTKSSLDVAWENAIRDSDVQSHIAKQRIKLSFIVQLSPWMRGFYGRSVGVSKMALRKANGKACLTMLQLQTFLTEIEAIINSRPLQKPVPS